MINYDVIKSFSLNDTDRIIEFLSCFINTKCKSCEDGVPVMGEINKGVGGKVLVKVKEVLNAIK